MRSDTPVRIRLLNGERGGQGSFRPWHHRRLLRSRTASQATLGGGSLELVDGSKGAGYSGGQKLPLGGFADCRDVRQTRFPGQNPSPAAPLKEIPVLQGGAGATFMALAATWSNISQALHM